MFITQIVCAVLLLLVSLPLLWVNLWSITPTSRGYLKIYKGGNEKPKGDAELEKYNKLLDESRHGNAFGYKYAKRVFVHNQKVSIILGSMVLISLTWIILLALDRLS